MADVVCAELAFNPVHSLRIWTRHNCRIIDQYINLLNIVIDASGSFADRDQTTEIEIDEFGPDFGVDRINAVDDRLDFAQGTTSKDEQFRRSGGQRSCSLRSYTSLTRTCDKD